MSTELRPMPGAVTTVTPVSETAQVIQMLERAASNPAVDVLKLEKLLEMQERILDRQARIAYTQALAAVQLALPAIDARGEIRIGTGKPQRYALWEDINETIKPILAEHGFALSFRTGMEESKIVVTGVLSHREGHSEQTTIYLPADKSGSKNEVQAVGSSTSYGKRYTASALLNLTTRGEDDDGAKGGAAAISEEQWAELSRLIQETNADAVKFCKFLHVEALTDLPASRFDFAVNALKEFAVKRGKK